MPREVREKAIKESGLPDRLFRPEEGESKMDIHVRCYKFMKLLIENHILEPKEKEKPEANS